MKGYGPPLLFFALLGKALVEVQPKEEWTTVKVEIGPNVRASDKGVSHVEPYIAAHPTDSHNLVIVASHNVEGKGLIAEAFTTKDAGKTWGHSPLPQMLESLLTNKLKYALDVWVTYGPDGVAYTSALASEKIHIQGQGRGELLVYRSEDQGKTWRGPTLISSRGFFDRPSMVATGTKNNTRIYLVARFLTMTILRSASGGRSLEQQIPGSGV